MTMTQAKKQGHQAGLIGFSTRTIQILPGSVCTTPALPTLKAQTIDQCMQYLPRSENNQSPTNLIETSYILHRLTTVLQVFAHERSQAKTSSDPEPSAACNLQ